MIEQAKWAGGAGSIVTQSMTYRVLAMTHAASRGRAASSVSYHDLNITGIADYLLRPILSLDARRATAWNLKTFEE